MPSRNSASEPLRHTAGLAPEAVRPPGHRWRVRDRSGTGFTGVDAYAAFADAVITAAPGKQDDIVASVRTGKQNNLAASVEDVYPGQRERSVRRSLRLPNGLFLGKNLTKGMMMELAARMTAAAGLTYGTDAVLELAE